LWKKANVCVGNQEGLVEDNRIVATCGDEAIDFNVWGCKERYSIMKPEQK